MTLPLFERYPGTASLARTELCSLPTPVDHSLGEAWEDEEFAATRPLHYLAVKRDDLTSATYGGNKVRKLEFLLGDALAKGAKRVITFGAYGSNHALATALYARGAGLEPHVVLSPQEPSPYAPRTLLAHARIGTVIHPVDGWDGRREAVRVKQELEREDGVEPYIIPMGGTCALGAAGYVNAALESVAQARAGEREVCGEDGRVAYVERGRDGAPLEPDVVYVAAGTLGTAVGLAIGFAAAGLPTRVEAVRVTPPEICNLELAEALTEQTVSLLRAADPSFPELALADLHFDLRGEFFEPGYGVPTPETLDAVKIAAIGGLKLETTYTGKAFSALLDDAASGRLDSLSDHVWFWDTYSSAPYPAPGRAEDLPAVLQNYVGECRRLFPSEVPE